MDKTEKRKLYLAWRGRQEPQREHSQRFSEQISISVLCTGNAAIGRAPSSYLESPSSPVLERSELVAAPLQQSQTLSAPLQMTTFHTWTCTRTESTFQKWGETEWSQKGLLLVGSGNHRCRDSASMGLSVLFWTWASHWCFLWYCSGSNGYQWDVTCFATGSYLRLPPILRGSCYYPLTIYKETEVAWQEQSQDPNPRLVLARMVTFPHPPPQTALLWYNSHTIKFSHDSMACSIFTELYNHDHNQF